MKMRKLVMAAALALTACRPPYDFDQPFWFVVPADLDRVPRERVLAFADGALTNVGGYLDPAAGQVVYFEDAPNPEATCGLNEDGSYRHVALTLVPPAPQRPDLIYFCPPFHRLQNSQQKQVIYHELGHVWGNWHTPCDQPAVMVPNLGCWTSPGLALGSDSLYSPLDMRQLCARAVGGNCADGLRSYPGQAP